ncbi:MAG: hypothetical protein BZ138_08365 [Methanosphaera sp. rholeuAM270]|nr:MAG: hypothetical protein BZ138_08365 [Methanosphaera sp. rholeuAM270]
MKNNVAFSITGHGDELVKLEKMYSKSFMITKHIKRDYDDFYYQCEKDGFFKDLVKTYDYFKEILIDDTVVGFMLFTSDNESLI